MGNAILKGQDDAEQLLGDELTPGTQLMHGQYTVERFLNAGGFGITYMARDSLDRMVVIKECFPGAFCRRSTLLVTARSRSHQKELASIVRLFVQEARSLAKLTHPNIVGVHQVFEENDTAYMALDFVQGRDLLDVIEDPNVSIEPQIVQDVLRKTLDAVGFVHDQGILHRDISPDNILLDADNNPVLIDFGAAREEASKQSRVLSALRVVKDGYSPQEFYISGSTQGPYSDLYALGASFYHLLRGDLPPASQTRLASIAAGEPDPYQKLVGTIDGYPTKFLKALDKSLAVLPKDRIQSAQGWLDIIDGNASALERAVAKSSAKPTPAKAATLGKTKSKTPTKAVTSAPQAKSGKGKLMLGVAAIALIAVGVGVATQTDLLGTTDAPQQSQIPAPVVAPEPTQTAQVAPEPQIIAPTSVDTPAPTRPELRPARTAIFDVAPPVSDNHTPIDPTQIARAEPATVPVVEPTPVVETAQVGVVAPVVTVAPPASDVITPVVPVAQIDIAGLAPLNPTESLAAVTVPALDGAPLWMDVQGITAAIAPDIGPLATTDAAPVRVQIRMPALADTPLGAQTPDLVAMVPDPRPLRFSNHQLQTPKAAPQGAEIDTTPAAPLPARKETSVQIAGLDFSQRIELPYDGFFNPREGETRIFSVNNTPVTTRAEFDALVSGMLKNQQGDTLQLTVRVGLAAAATQEQIWSFPVIHRTALGNGLVFESVLPNGADTWLTRVAEVPSGLDVDLRAGDVMFGYLATSEVLSGRTAMRDILTREILQGTTVFNFAVKRGADTWASAFPFDGSATVSTN